MGSLRNWRTDSPNGSIDGQNNWTDGSVMFLDYMGKALIKAGIICLGIAALMWYGMTHS